MQIYEFLESQPALFIADCKVILQFEITLGQPPKAIGPRCSASGPSAATGKKNAPKVAECEGMLETRPLEKVSTFRRALDSVEAFRHLNPAALWLRSIGEAS